MNTVAGVRIINLYTFGKGRSSSVVNDFRDRVLRYNTFTFTLKNDAVILTDMPGFPHASTSISFSETQHLNLEILELITETFLKPKLNDLLNVGATEVVFIHCSFLLQFNFSKLEKFRKSLFVEIFFPVEISQFLLLWYSLPSPALFQTIRVQ